MVGQVIAVASGKGGVGKTTTVVNLGVVLRRTDRSVALVDADLGMANLGPMLGITPEHTLHDVLAGEATVEEAIVEEAQGFGVLAGSASLADYPDADPAGLRAVLETLAAEYEFVLVDTGAGMSHEDVLPLGIADVVLLVTTPDPAAIGDTRKTAELANLAKGTPAGLVVNKAEADTDAKYAASQVGVELLGVIPFDATVRQSTAAGRPLEAVDPETPAAAAYRRLADAVADGKPEPVDDPPAPEVAESDEGSRSAAEPDETPEATDEGNSAGTDDDGDATGEPPEPAASDELGGQDLDLDLDDSLLSELGDPDGEADDEPTGAGAESGESAASMGSEDTASDDGESDAPVDADDGGENDASGDAEPENGEAVDEPEDPLAEFDDDEPEGDGGFLSRFGRLFK